VLLREKKPGWERGGDTLRVRTLVATGLTSLALAAATAFSSGAAVASSTSHPASLRGTFHGKYTPQAIDKKKKGKCGTKFGSELPTPDGLIAWNDTSGTTFDEAGAADVNCTSKKAKKRTIKKVTVNGYYGQPSELFNVTFYGNDPTDGTNEPDDNNVLCSYSSLPGAAGGQYPTHVTTVLTLPTSCVLPQGESWVAVQNYDSAGPWYWEMQTEQSGDRPDWIDRHDVFGSGCTTWSNDRYLVDCLGYDYGDFMLLLN
jgi:hypothetical protein